MRHRYTALFVSSLSLCSVLTTHCVDAHAGTTTCIIKIGLGASQLLSSAQFAVDYSSVQGTFLGAGLAAECRTSLPNAMITANDDCTGDYAQCQWGPSRSLHIAILDSGTGFAGPRDIAHCKFETAETISQLDFKVTLEQATESTDSSDSIPPPLLDILAVECPQSGT